MLVLETYHNGCMCWDTIDENEGDIFIISLVNREFYIHFLKEEDDSEHEHEYDYNISKITCFPDYLLFDDGTLYGITE